MYDILIKNLKEINFNIENDLSVLLRSKDFKIDLRPAGILIPIYNLKGKWNIVLTKRTHTVETHKGEISFPGGTVDEEDSSLEATAVRETKEEIGIPKKFISIVGKMSPLPTITGFLVHPFVAVITEDINFVPSKGEVEKIITVPLSFFIKNSPEKKDGYNFMGINYKIYNYYFENEKIWGATARIIKYFIDVVKPYYKKLFV